MKLERQPATSESIHLTLNSGIKGDDAAEREPPAGGSCELEGAERINSR